MKEERVNYQVKPGAMESINECIEKQLRVMNSGDRLLLDYENAQLLMLTMRELEAEATALNKPRLFYFEKPGNFYLNPKTVAFIGFDAQGCALVQTVNGALIKVEALQWQIAQEQFMKAFEIVRIRSTSGLVSA